MIFAESPRLILRRPEPADYQALIRAWSHPDMTRYTQRHEDVERFVAQLICDMGSKQPGETEPGGPWYQLVLERRADRAVIGDIGIGFGIPGEHQVELGYRVHTDHQRQGFAREAVAAAIDFLIEQHQIHRFVAVAAEGNEASVRLLRSLGFREEGHFRQSFFCNGEWLDDHYFALLAGEWQGAACSHS